MKCLVTGAAGGIGSHLCERLVADGHTVIGLDDMSVGRNRPPCELIERDICSGVMPREARGTDWLFHLAALADIVPSISKPYRYHQVNVTGTMRMLEWARANGVRRFLYAASSSCYGADPRTPTPETEACFPAYPYALTKYLGEQYVSHYAKVFGLNATSLRLFNVYGPRFRTSGTYGAVFGVFLAQLAAGRPLTVVGDGTQQRDFTYVSDVCNAFIRAAESDGLAGEVFNVGSGTPTSINNLVDLLDPVGRIALPKRPGEPAVTHADIRKIRARLGWSPSVSLKQGVAEMLKHLPEYANAPLWSPEAINEATQEWFRRLS